MTAEFESPAAKLAARRSERTERPRTADRQPKAEPLKPKFSEAEVEIEFNDRTYKVNPQVLDDWNLLERMATGELSEQGFMLAQYRALLGEDGMAELKEDIEESFGYVSATIMGRFVQAVTEQVDSGN